MNVTDMPLVEPPRKLPKGFEFRSDGKTWVIWVPEWDKHVTFMEVPSVNDVNAGLNNLAMSRLFDEFPDEKYKGIFIRKARAALHGTSLDEDDLKYLARGTELRELTHGGDNGQA